VIQAIVFDAVGTLIYPQPAVADAYYGVAARYGSQQARDDIRARFRAALADDLARDQAREDWTTDDRRERDRWRDIVRRTLTDIPAALDDAFDELWDHFAAPAHWRLFPDVEWTWMELARRGYRLGIASNFDARLETVCHGVPLLSAADFVFHSAGLRVRKPATEFFRRIAQQLQIEPSGLLMVGDCPRADYEGARQAGWHALWLDRSALASESASAPERLANLRDLVARLAL
jgi:putative hydrolase of the HAD superfamily